MTGLVEMPETAVDEDDLATASEHEIGAAGQIFAVADKVNPEASHDSSHNDFWLCVLTSNQSHPLASLRLGQCVHVKTLAG